MTEEQGENKTHADDHEDEDDHNDASEITLVSSNLLKVKKLKVKRQKSHQKFTI